VYELYSPKRHELEINFFPGPRLHDNIDSYWTTWQARGDKKVVWPNDWLNEKLPNGRILSVSYVKSATRSLKSLKESLRCSMVDLVNDIVLDENVNIGQSCPVILAGHSLGGSVLKQLLSSMIDELTRRREVIKDVKKEDKVKKERLDQFLKSVKGLFYFATPHSDSRIHDLAETIPEKGPILEFFKKVQHYSAAINVPSFVSIGKL
jgi:hypothetical protein